MIVMYTVTPAPDRPPDQGFFDITTDQGGYWEERGSSPLDALNNLIFHFGRFWYPQPTLFPNVFAVNETR